MKVRYLVEINIDPMKRFDMSVDVRAIQDAIWESFAHLPKEAIRIIPLVSWGLKPSVAEAARLLQAAIDFETARSSLSSDGEGKVGESGVPPAPADEP